MDYSSVKVGYTFNSIDTANVSAKIHGIQNILAEIFGEGFEQVSFVSNVDKSEVVFKIDTPVFNTPVQKNLFFINLSRLFTETKDLKPYFCDYKGEDHE